MGQLMGVHCTSTGQFRGLGDYLSQVRAAGKPLSIQSVDATVGVYDAQRNGYHVNDGLCFRMTSKAGENLDRLPVDPVTGLYTGNPEEVAVQRWERIVYHWPPELDSTRIYTVTINEPSKELGDIDYIARYTLEQGKWAIQHNRRYLAYGWSSGTPEPSFWEYPTTLEYLRLCEQYPKLLGVSLHEYSLDSRDIKKLYPYRVGRLQRLYDVCDRNGIARPYVHIGEFGWAEDSINLSDNEVREQLDWTNTVYGTNNVSLCLWTLGNWHGMIVAQVGSLMDVVTERAINSVIDVVVPPTTTPLPKIVIYKLPQEVTKNEWVAEAAKAYTYLRTITASVDDMLSMMAKGDKITSYAIIVDPDKPSQQEAIAELNKQGYKWVEG